MSLGARVVARRAVPVAVLLALAAPAGAERVTVSLNGTWEIAD